jgi:5-methylcytosine-specific restriction endonuclease McrA
MPIKKENLKLYPSNWKDISYDIRFNRSNGKCEVCGAINYSYVNSITRELCLQDEDNAIMIVLTVAHLDHNPSNCDYSNLMAMCQKCHNNYDKSHRKQTRQDSKNVNQLKLL